MELKENAAISKRSTFFYIAFVLLLLVEFLSINTDLAQFSQRKDTGIADWFFYLIFTVDFVVVGSLVLMFFFRKIGVFMFPTFVLIHFLLHSFYLSTTLISDMNVLFFFFAAGLLVVIPRWEKYK